jgi:predicted RNA-binding Zn ribbon-like protein
VSASADLRFDTGRTCLDLIATVGARLSAQPVERLTGPERLTAWLRGTGLVPPGEPFAADGEWLAEFTALRTRLHRIVHAELDGGRAAAHDIDQVNRVAAAGRPASRLVRDADGTLRRRPAGLPRLGQFLAVVAEDAIDLLGSPDREDLRECAGPTCDLVYLDTSRGRRRRWCSPSACGNRHYVATHRAKRAGQL